MKYLIPIVIVVMAALLALVWYQSKMAERARWERETENKAHQQRVSEIQAALLKERGKVEAERKKRSKGDSIFRASISKLKGQNQSLAKKLTDLRVPVQVLGDSITVLGEFLKVNDSLQAGKAVEIGLLTAQIDTLKQSHASEVKHLESQILDLQTANVANLERVAGLEKDLNKAVKRANKRLSFGIGAGGSVINHNGEVVVGTGIHGGIQYRLFRL